MGARRRNGSTLPEVLPSESILFPDADEVCGRADDDVLPVCQLRPSVERKLIPLPIFPFRHTFATWLVALCVFFSVSLPTVLARDDSRTSPFSIILFMCVWKRPILTDFVLSHYHRMREALMAERISLEIFIAGSENSTATLAGRFQAGFVILPNSPLGTKHDKGLRSLRDYYMSRGRLPDAVAIVGSDDVINVDFFLQVRDVMCGPPPRKHFVGLRDIFFYDLKSRRLVYTQGYRSYETPISGTLGCGRVFSWAILDSLDWHVWDEDRERGLDQSAIRNVMKSVPFVAEVSEAIAGREAGIVAVDIKSDAFSAGANIWRFDQVVSAVGKNGRLHEFVDYDADATLGHAFETQFLSKLEEMRTEMIRAESD